MDATHSERTLQILGLCYRHFWMAMRLSCKFRFHIGILNQHWLVEQGRRPMTGWPATVAPKWAKARNHAAAVEEDVIREAPVVPTGGQAGRWQAITDTTTIEYALVSVPTIGGGGDTTIPSPGRSPKQPLPGIGLHGPLHGREACPEFNSFHQEVGQISPREGLFSCRPFPNRGQSCDIPAPPNR